MKFDDERNLVPSGHPLRDELGRGRNKESLDRTFSREQGRAGGEIGTIEATAKRVADVKPNAGRGGGA